MPLEVGPIISIYLFFRRNAPGLFSVFSCKYTIIFPASDYVRDVDDPTEICEQIDRIDHYYWHLNGYKKGLAFGQSVIYPQREMFVHGKQIWRWPSS